MRSQDGGGRAAWRALRIAATVGVGLGSGGCGSAASPVTHTVEIRGFAFVPATLELTPGDTVVWINRDIVPHTATSTLPGWDTGSIAPGDSARVAADVSGPADYLCAFHPTMRGSLLPR